MKRKQPKFFVIVDLSVGHLNLSFILEMKIQEDGSGLNKYIVLFAIILCTKNFSQTVNLEVLFAHSVLFLFCNKILSQKMFISYRL